MRNSALYGLHLVDLQQRHVTRITITLVKHLRAIARSFAHMSQESSQALLVRLQVEDPLQFLLRRSQTLLAQTRDSCDPMVARPRILNWLVHTTESKLALSSHLEPPPPSVPTTSALPPDPGVQSATEPTPASIPGPLQGVPWGDQIASKRGPRTAQFMCPTCLLWFPDLMVLKRHHRQSHNAPLPDPQSSLEAAEVREHSLDGMPVCKRCCKDFVTWFNLKRHLQKGHCTARWTDQAPILSLEPVDGSPPILDSNSVQVQLSSPAQPPAVVPPLPEVTDQHPRQVPAAEASRPLPHTVCAQLAAHVPSQAKDWLRFASLVGLKLSKSFAASVAFVVSGWPTSAVPSITIGPYIRPSMRSSTLLRQQTVNVSAILYHLVHFVVL